MSNAKLIADLANRNPYSLEDLHSLICRMAVMDYWTRVSKVKSSNGKAYVASFFTFRDKSQIEVRSNMRGETMEILQVIKQSL